MEKLRAALASSLKPYLEDDELLKISTPTRVKVVFLDVMPSGERVLIPSAESVAKEAIERARIAEVAIYRAMKRR